MILYELLVGRPPFRGTTVLETLEQVKMAEPVPPSRLVPGRRGRETRAERIESPRRVRRPAGTNSRALFTREPIESTRNIDTMDVTISRRRFLQRTAALTVAAGLPTPAPGYEPAAMPIVDTHQHLWDLTRFKLPWLKGASKLDRSFLMEDYRQAIAGLNVVRSVYMEVDVEPAQQAAEADYVLDLIRRGDAPLVAAVISGRPASEGFAASLARYRDQPAIKGLRRVLHAADTPPGHCLDRQFIAGIRHLGELGLSFDLCMRSTELGDAAKLIDACPGTAFVLDHCGNASVRAKDLSAWKADIGRIAERKNVVCKVSGIVASAAPGPWTTEDLAPIVNHVLDRFGPDRVVFGGDWPVCTFAATYRQWVEALRSLVADRPQVDQKKLFHDNAIRVYRLS
jgi:predicted TIM-barrel fold metal-dependent hydrolase